MKVLVTGSAGFIGYHLSNTLLSKGYEVIGIDNINDYYDVNLKYGRLKEAGIDKESINYAYPVKSSIFPKYTFIKLGLEDSEAIEILFKKEKFDKVVNLAAQAGVRYSLKNPAAYLQSNMAGFLNILEGCRHTNVKHLIYASSSSVYGLNKTMPFSVDNNVDHPVSLYAASKKSNELMAHSYSHLYNIPTTGLRFFTVYGPWGRPDMAYFSFSKSIYEGKPIDVYNYGNMERDFTYIDDIVECIERIVNKAAPEGDTTWGTKGNTPASSSAPYRVYNIGNNTPVKLLDFINEIEKATGIEANKNMMPIQPGDVVKTWADVDSLIHDYGYRPDTKLEYGIKEFIKWYKKYYQL